MFSLCPSFACADIVWPCATLAVLSVSVLVPVCFSCVVGLPRDDEERKRQLVPTDNKDDAKTETNNVHTTLAIPARSDGCFVGNTGRTHGKTTLFACKAERTRVVCQASVAYK